VVCLSIRKKIYFIIIYASVPIEYGGKNLILDW